MNRIVIAVNRRLFCSGLDSARENRLKLLFPDLQKLWQLHGVVRANNGLFIGGCTNYGFICLCIAVQFNDKCTAAWLEQFFRCQLLGKAETDEVTKAHLCNAFCNTAEIYCPDSSCTVVSNDGFYLVEASTNAVEVRQTIFQISWLYENNLAVCVLKFCGNNMVSLCGGNSEGNERRRNVNLFKCTRHGVFTADCTAGEFQLCLECTEQGCHWLAPAFRIVLCPFKVFLESQPAVMPATACCNNFCNGFYNGTHCTVVRAAFADQRIITPAHERAGICFATEHRNLCCHCLRWGQLISTAERHQNRSCTDGGVKHFYQTLLRANIQVGEQFLPAFCTVWHCCRSVRLWSRDDNIGIFCSTV